MDVRAIKATTFNLGGSDHREAPEDERGPPLLLGRGPGEERRTGVVQRVQDLAALPRQAHKRVP